MFISIRFNDVYELICVLYSFSLNVFYFFINIFYKLSINALIISTLALDISFFSMSLKPNPQRPLMSEIHISVYA